MLAEHAGLEKSVKRNKLTYTCFMPILCPAFLLHAGYLEACHLQQERHGTAAAAQQVEVPARKSANSFFQAFVAFCVVYAGRTSLTSLGVEGMPGDPLCACPVCAQLPAGNTMVCDCVVLFVRQCINPWPVSMLDLPL